MNRADPLLPTEAALLHQHLARTASARDRLIAELALQTGLRCSELLSLRVHEVWDGRAPLPTLRLPRSRFKGGKGVHARAVRGRVIPLNDAAQAAIARHCADTDPTPRQDWLFGNGRGGPLTRQQFSRIVRRLCVAAGLPRHKVWSSHSLRRSFAEAIATRRGIEVARVCLGHRNLATTHLYVSATEEEAHAAILELGHPHQKAFSRDDLPNPADLHLCTHP